MMNIHTKLPEIKLSKAKCWPPTTEHWAKIPPRINEWLRPMIGDRAEKLTKEGAIWLMTSAIDCVTKFSDSSKPLLLEILDDSIPVNLPWPESYIKEADADFGTMYPSFFLKEDKYPNKYEYLALAGWLASELGRGRWFNPGLGSCGLVSDRWLDDDFSSFKDGNLSEEGLLLLLNIFLDVQFWGTEHRSVYVEFQEIIGYNFLAMNTPVPSIADRLHQLVYPKRAYTECLKYLIVERFCYDILLGLWRDCNPSYIAKQMNWILSSTASTDVFDPVARIGSHLEIFNPGQADELSYLHRNWWLGTGNIDPELVEFGSEAVQLITSVLFSLGFVEGQKDG